MNFTQSRVRNIEPRDTRFEIRDDKQSGLLLRVTPSGKKSWCLSYRFNGRPRRLTLGRFPELTVDKARQQAHKMMAQVYERIDPGEERRRARKAAANALTVELLVERYIEQYARPRKRSWKEDERLLRHDLVRKLGRRRAIELTRAELRELLQDVVDRDAPTTSNRLRSAMNRMFGFAVESDILEHNPLQGIRPLHRERARTRFLNATEIWHFWNGLEEARIEPVTRLALKLLLVTGQRIGEITGSRWEDIDDSQATLLIPGEHTKNGQEHLVPLSDLARNLLVEAYQGTGNTPYILCSPTSKSGDPRPIVTTSLNHAIRRNAEVFQIEKFTPHDLRRTVGTQLAKLSETNRFIIQRVLNHTDRSVTGIYDRYDYLPEKRKALDTWANRIEYIVSQKLQDLVAAEQSSSGHKRSIAEESELEQIVSSMSDDELSEAQSDITRSPKPRQTEPETEWGDW